MVAGIYESLAFFDAPIDAVICIAPFGPAPGEFEQQIEVSLTKLRPAPSQSAPLAGLPSDALRPLVTIPARSDEREQMPRLELSVEATTLRLPAPIATPWFAAVNQASLAERFRFGIDTAEAVVRFLASAAIATGLPDERHARLQAILHQLKRKPFLGDWVQALSKRLASFRPLISTCAGYNAATFRLQSPNLFDPATQIGRSSAIPEGSAADTGGVPVGTAATIVKDSDLLVGSPWFDGAAGPLREVHTEVRALNLSLGGPGGPYVRGGTAGPVVIPPPKSPGEVESQDTTGNPANDFPANSFFDVFVEVNLPMTACPGASQDLILHNTYPLLVHSENLPVFPPKIIYIHGNTTAVPVYFETSNPPQWNAGDLLGWLVLAGHGAGFDRSNPSDVAQFNTFMQSQPEMPLPSQGGNIDSSMLFPVNATNTVVGGSFFDVFVQLNAPTGAPFIGTQSSLVYDSTRVTLTNIVDLTNGPFYPALCSSALNDTFGGTLPPPLLAGRINCKTTAGPAPAAAVGGIAVYHFQTNLPGLTGVHLYQPGELGGTPDTFSTYTLDTSNSIQTDTYTCTAPPGCFAVPTFPNLPLFAHAAQTLPVNVVDPAQNFINSVDAIRLEADGQFCPSPTLPCPGPFPGNSGGHPTVPNWEWRTARPLTFAAGSPATPVPLGDHRGNSWVYTQAQEEPAGSGNLSLYLMYDYFGRTNPLAPSECVRVNFAVNGGRFTGPMSVQICGNGAILVDGLDGGAPFQNRPGSSFTPPISGAPGFGKSPNVTGDSFFDVFLNTDHVLAELEVPLNQRLGGGNPTGCPTGTPCGTYDPSPAFWKACVPPNPGTPCSATDPVSSSVVSIDVQDGSNATLPAADPTHPFPPFFDPGAGHPCIQDHGDDFNGDGYSDSDQATPMGMRSCKGAFPPSGGLGQDPALPCPGRPAGSPAALLARADVNLDGMVNALDLNNLGKHFLEMYLAASDFRADLDQNGDKAINALDLNVLGKRFLQSVPPC